MAIEESAGQPIPRRGRGRRLPALPWRELWQSAWKSPGAWHDRVAMGLALGAAAALLALFLYLKATVAELPFVLPFHFTTMGEPDRIAPREAIFRLPLIGALVLATNLTLAILLHRRQRPASLILLAAALVVQLIFWWAAFNIIF